MAELTVDLVYGTALREAARDTGMQQEIMDDGFQVLEILDSEPEFKAFMDYPAISAEEKKKVLKEIFEGRICRELMNFLCVLVDKRRTDRFGYIMKVYKNLTEREDGVSYGTVYSVVKLDDDRLASLQEQTSKLLRMNVKLENEIDESLIAGVKILVEGKIIDASFRKKFDELAARLRSS